MNETNKTTAHSVYRDIVHGAVVTVSSDLMNVEQLQPTFRPSQPTWPVSRNSDIRPVGCYLLHAPSPYQSKARTDFLLVINSNWHPISCHFGVVAACSNFGHLRSWAILGGLRGNVRCTSWAHFSGLPISVNIELFSIEVTAEALRAKIDGKSAFSLQRG